MPRSPLEILYEDNHLLVVNKPAGLATMGVAPDEPSLWRHARDYLKEQYNKPGNVYLGVVSRVDRLVTGVVIFARTSKAAGRLSAMLRERTLRKRYWALVAPGPRANAGELVDWVQKDEGAQRMRVVSRAAAASGAQEARLTFRRRGQQADQVALEVDLETGRKHQIRLQLSHAGWPILGDQKYGSLRPFPRGIGLHARELEFEHPVQHRPLRLTAPTPAYWPAWVGE